ncbi:MAG: iron-sulfur cluster-binding domain-containing protein [Taibaiella sp.]|nr:iron-sulfur cluster-binding domain-containing protein [Taibaiella sp.]
MPDIPDIINPFYEVRILSVTKEVQGVSTYILARPDGIPLTYRAGQFITFTAQHRHKEERRTYSISSCPALNEPFSITVKRVENGYYSRMLIDNAQPGDLLLSTGCAGLFTLPDENDYEQVFLLAAGIGITPVFSLLKEILHTKPATHVTLIYSNRSKEETVFYNALQDLLIQFPERFQIAFLYSSAFDIARARLSKALLPVLLQEYGKANKDKMLFYVCGPFTYMRMVLLTLEELGINSAQVKKENFNTEIRNAVHVVPPDTTTRTVTIKTQQHQYNFPVVYPDSILQAAKKQQVMLPYSCETGRCGSCVAICSGGRVWHSYNEVLTDADIAAGRILTCTGHPVYGDVTLDL